MDIHSLASALVLGMVEGLTEFLPVSSTGHLILVNMAFAFKDPRFTTLFDYVIQTGAILAVVVHFRRRVIPFWPGLSREERKDSWQMWAKAVAGFLPAVVLGVLFIDTIEAWLMSPFTVAVSLLAWGIAMFVVETMVSRGMLRVRTEKVGDMGWGLVVAIGFIQCLAMIPGTSRSAATILGALLLGTSRVAAAEFSFFLAIPTLAGAGAWGLLKELRRGMELTGDNLVLLGIGFVTAFLVALGVVRFFMSFITRHDFKPFAVYRVLLGAGILIALGSGLLPAAGA